MKIIHIELGQSLYGGAKQAVMLARKQQKNNLDVHLICPEGSMIATYITDLPIIKVPYYGSLDFSGRNGIRKVIKQMDPDIVHCHSRRGADSFGSLGLIKAKTVLTRRVIGSEPKWILRRKLSRFSQLVAISHAIQKNLNDCLGVDKNSIPIIHSSADYINDIEERECADFNIKPPLKLLLVSQLIKRKQCHVALVAVKKLLDHGHSVTLDCFGTGPMKRKLVDYVRKNNLSGSVFFNDYDPNLEKNYCKYDILIHTANNEGLGAVIIEAMANQVPVIATKIGGITDLIDDQETGLLFEAGNCTMLMDKIIYLSTHSNLIRKIKKNAVLNILRDFNINQNEKKYYKLYESLL
jgi:glycosyltransferase involved in cell wall biosynthesis